MFTTVKYYLDRVMEYTIYLYIIVLPWQTRWIIKAGEINGGYWEYGTYSLYASDIVLAGLFLLWALRWAMNRYPHPDPLSPLTPFIPLKPKSRLSRWWDRALYTAIFLFWTLNLASIINASDQALALYRLGWLTAALALFGLVRSLPLDPRRLLWVLAASALVPVILGLAQFGLQESWGNKWLGLTRHDAKVLGTSVVEIEPDERWLRAYSSLDHPNIFGGFLVLVLALLIPLIIRELDNDDRNRSWAMMLAFWVYAAAVAVSMSRSAWLALLFVILGLAIVGIVRYGRGHAAWRLALITLITLTAIFFPWLRTRVIGSARLEVRSNVERSIGLSASLDALREKPWLGTGIGQYTLRAVPDSPKKDAWSFQPAHDLWLLVAGEAGIPALVMIALILAIIFLKQLLISNFYQGVFYITLAISLLIVLSFDHWAWSLHFGLFWLFLILGLLDRKISIFFPENVDKTVSSD